jgi:hypothetical protein
MKKFLWRKLSSCLSPHLLLCGKSSSLLFQTQEDGRSFEIYFLKLRKTETWNLTHLKQLKQRVEKSRGWKTPCLLCCTDMRVSDSSQRADLLKAMDRDPSSRSKEL